MDSSWEMKESGFKRVVTTVGKLYYVDNVDYIDSLTEGGSFFPSFSDSDQNYEIKIVKFCILII